MGGYLEVSQPRRFLCPPPFTSAETLPPSASQLVCQGFIALDKRAEPLSPRADKGGGADQAEQFMTRGGHPRQH